MTELVALLKESPLSCLSSLLTLKRKKSQKSTYTFTPYGIEKESFLFPRPSIEESQANHLAKKDTLHSEQEQQYSHLCHPTQVISVKIVNLVS